MYIQKITVQLSKQHNIGFQAFHSLLNHRSPGLRMEEDLTTNPNGPDGFYITGLTPKASEAIGLIALEYNLELIRLDIAFNSPVTLEHIDRANYLDYHFQVERLRKHISDKKYVGHHGQYTHFSVNHYVMGAEKSIKQLILRDHTDPPMPVHALQIIWRLRQNWAKEAWVWVQKSDSFDKGLDLAFMAATNTFLGPDWFGLGHSDSPTLQRLSKPIEKKQDVDWRGLLDQAVSAYQKQQVIGDTYDLVADFADYLDKCFAHV